MKLNLFQYKFVQFFPPRVVYLCPEINCWWHFKPFPQRVARFVKYKYGVRYTAVSLFLTYPTFSCFITCCVWSEVDFLFTDDVVATECDLVQTLTILFSYDTLQGCVQSTVTCLWKSFFFTIEDLLMEKAFRSIKLFFHCYDLICPHLLCYLYTRTIWKGSS